MVKRIDATELERLISDDSVSDETIAQYLKPATVRGLPFEPMLTVNEATVVSANRSIIGLTVSALNARSNRRRLAAYEARIGSGWKGLKILAEGDSWFLYPILLNDVVANLSDDYAIYSVASAGDTLENMVRGTAHLEELIQEHGFDAMLFSAGGNDIAGDMLRSYLCEPAGSSAGPGQCITPQFEEFLATAKARIGGIISRLTAKFPHLQIFGHGYDWPFPHARGIWLQPAFSARKIPGTTSGPILKMMIDRYYGMLGEIAAGSDGRYHVVDCRGCVGPIDQWFDELHPLDPGFTRAADRFRNEIARVFGQSKDRGATTEVRIAWRPREDRTGVRTLARTYPRGAMITVGRSGSREIVLDDDRVSRNHASLRIAGEWVDVEDAGSSNGTFIAGKKIVSERWLPGQELLIGPFAFTLDVNPALQPTPSPASPGMGSGGSTSARHLNPDSTPNGLPAVANGAESSAALDWRHLEIVVSNDSITREAAPAWAVGVFENVNPLSTSGPARAIDERLDGLLSRELENRMIDGRAGSTIHVSVPAERGLFGGLFMVGLGFIRDFLPQTLDLAGEKLAQCLVQAHVFELATIPIGLNSGLSVKQSVENFLTGFLRGLRTADETRAFRKVMLCEVQADRYAELRNELEALTKNDALSKLGFKLSFREQARDRPSGAPAAPTVKDALPAPPSPTTVERHTPRLYVEVINKSGSVYEYGFLGLSSAAMRSIMRDISVSSQLKAVLESPSCPLFDDDLGNQLTNAYLPPELQLWIDQEVATDPRHFMIVHDAASSAIPWEGSFINGRSVALEFGLSRRPRPAARSLDATQPRRAKLSPDGWLRMLLVCDPTSNLVGAEVEAREIEELFAKAGCEVKTLRQTECTKDAVLGELSDGRYDLLHFAGHAAFAELQPESSGIILSDGSMLCASDLEPLPAVPRLIFLNACQSGRVRSAAPAPDQAAAGDGRTNHASLAEGFIMRNVAQFVGTHWTVNDAAARSFANAFYSSLLAGEPIGTAVRKGRQALRQGGLRDWVNYLHFGDPDGLLRMVPLGGPDPQPNAGERDGIRGDPLSGEQRPDAEGSDTVRSASELPITRDQTLKATQWLWSNFLGEMRAAVQGTPFSVEHLCAVACQETAYFWVSLIDRLPAQTILERCVLDACGDFPDTTRRAFPSNTAAFRRRYGDDFTNMLIDEANKTRALRKYKPREWVYKGYGLFQYDLQYVVKDEAFFRNREWHRFDACLSRAIRELTEKYRQTGDVWRAIRAYNGAGPGAERYARNVQQFSEWCALPMIA